MSQQGVEILIATSDFWRSRCQRAEEALRYNVSAIERAVSDAFPDNGVHVTSHMRVVLDWTDDGQRYGVKIVVPSIMSPAQIVEELKRRVFSAAKIDRFARMVPDRATFWCVDPYNDPFEEVS